MTQIDVPQSPRNPTEATLEDRRKLAKFLRYELTTDFPLRESWSIAWHVIRERGLTVDEYIERVQPTEIPAPDPTIDHSFRRPEKKGTPNVGFTRESLDDFAAHPFMGASFYGSHANG